MITCKLGGKEYSIDFVKGRALREIDSAAKMYGKLLKISEAAQKGDELEEADKKISVQQAMDVMVSWFCVLFQNQFTPAEVYDNYPADRLMPDIATAILAVQMQTTNVLSEFPTTPTAQTKKK